MKLHHSALTDVGRSREINQDSFGVGDQLPDGSRIFVVCDGMGGHLAGEIASRTAVDTLLETFTAHETTDHIQGLSDSVQAANEAVFQRGQGNMGTTAVALLLFRNIALIANVGDSRGYLLRDGKLRQVTNDHSFVEEQVRAGLLTHEQARRSVHRHMITRAVGYQQDVQVDVFREPVQAGDRFLLCSDGLYGPVDDETIAQVLTDQSPDEAAQTLIDLANAAGGPDNITALIVDVLELDTIPATDPLLESLLKADLMTATTAPLPVEELRKGPTGTDKIPLISDAPPPAAVPVEHERERGLSLWGALGALTVVLLVVGGLYLSGLPPFGAASVATTTTPSVPSATSIAVPTTTLVPQTITPPGSPVPSKQTEGQTENTAGPTDATPVTPAAATPTP